MGIMGVDENRTSTSASVASKTLESIPTASQIGSGSEDDNNEQWDVTVKFLNEMGGRADAAELLAPYTPAEEARVKRKIDCIIFPVLFFSTLMSGTDKVILGTAATFGLRTDLGLKGQQYSWGNSMLSFGMLAMMLPQGYLAQRYNVIGKVFAATVVGYGIVMFGMSGIKDYKGLYATRFMLGALEAANPSLGGLLISMWWKRDEQNIRAAMIFSTFSSVVNGLLSYAMQFYNPGPLSRWRLGFLVMACWSCLTGAVALVFLPNSPTAAWWLTDREKVIAVRRVAGNRTGVNSLQIKRSQIIEAITDLKTWALFLTTVCLNIPNGGLTGFYAIIVNSLGFSVKETTLLAIPTGVISWVSALVIAFAAQKTRRPVLCVVAGILVCMVAVIMLYIIPQTNKSASLGAMLLLFVYWGPIVATNSYLIYANVAGASKKVAVYCACQMGYCTGNLIAPQTFIASEAPTYHTAIAVQLGGYSISICLLGVYGFLCWRDNQRKDKAARREDGIEQAHRIPSELDTEWKDLTDKQNPAFRYTW